MLPEDVVTAIMGHGECEIDLPDKVVRFDGEEIPFELDDDIHHRLVNGLDDIGADAAAGGRDRRLRGPARAHAAPSRPSMAAWRMAHHIVLLPGDGIGPEVIAADHDACWTPSASSATRST